MRKTVKEKNVDIKVQFLKDILQVQCSDTQTLMFGSILNINGHDKKENAKKNST